MVDFIDKHRMKYGVEPICAVLPIAPSTYYAHRACRLDPERRCARKKRDEVLRVEIRRVFEESFGGVYGVKKVWRQLLREGVVVARRIVGPPLGPGAARLRRDATERALGRGHHVRGDVGGLRVRGLRHRRVLPRHRRLARLAFASK
jgi:hypothetical protein